MKENLVIITRLNNNGSDVESEEINKYLRQGWTVVSVTAQHVTTVEDSSCRFGNFLLVLEREKVSL